MSVTYLPQDVITEQLSGCEFQVSSQAFFQVCCDHECLAVCVLGKRCNTIETHISVNPLTSAIRLLLHDDMFLLLTDSSRDVCIIFAFLLTMVM